MSQFEMFRNETSIPYRAGDVTFAIGDMALVAGEKRSATALAATDCRLVEISEKRFLFLVQQTPFFALELMRVIAARSRRRDPHP